MADFLKISGLTRNDTNALLDGAASLKKEWHDSLKRGMKQTPYLEGRVLAMLFEKPSLRTRCSFEAGMFQLGGHAINLNANEVGRLGERESIGDTARNLARWCQLIQARVFSHAAVEELAESSDVPVINGLSDFEHPTQIIADYLTIQETRGGFEGLRLGWIGDGNNVAHSLMAMACLYDHEIALAIPEGYDPLPEAWEACERINGSARKLIRVVRDPFEAAQGADVLYTDVWASMGQESEAEVRERAFLGFQINRRLLESAPKHAVVLHDMPAKRGKEITDEVLDGDRCLAFDQAENRLHAIKAILCWCAGVSVV